MIQMTQLKSKSENWKSITVQIEQPANDYHDLVLVAIRELSTRLYGGYYEPASHRDLELAKALDRLYLSYF